jgi:hypothetical protein
LNEVTDVKHVTVKEFNEYSVRDLNKPGHSAPKAVTP